MDSGFDLARVLFFGSIAAAIPFAAWRIFAQLRTRAPRAFAQIEERGYAVEFYADGNSQVGTRIWGRLAAPTPLYLQLSNRAGLRKLVGLCDVKTSDLEFDRRFWVRSNHPELVRDLLTVGLRQRLLGAPDIEFQSGSPATLLAADYWPEGRGEEQLRTLWMVRAVGRKQEPEQTRLLEIGQSLARAIERMAPQTGDRESLRTPMFEGV